MLLTLSQLPIDRWNITRFGFLPQHQEQFLLHRRIDGADKPVQVLVSHETSYIFTYTFPSDPRHTTNGRSFSTLNKGQHVSTNGIKWLCKEDVGVLQVYNQVVFPFSEQ